MGFVLGYCAAINLQPLDHESHALPLHYYATHWTS